MSAITQCPHCDTRFKVSDTQLEAHAGMVRCGRCQQVFNALEHLQDNEPSPQLQLDIESDAVSPSTISPSDLSPTFDSSQLDIEHFMGTSELAPTTLDVPMNEPSLIAVDIEKNGLHAIEPLPTSDNPQPITETAVTDSAPATDAPLTLAQQVQFLEDAPAALAAATNSPNRGLHILVSMLLLLTLLLQVLYFFRVEIAARLPGLKPLMVQACHTVGCVIALPQVIELVTIDSSELKTEAEQVNVITLNALLRNHATYSQAYPSLELTLTDTQDKALARRIFHPVDYLKAGNSSQNGLAANRELDIALPIDASELKPSGYRLFLFYPQ
ncbi:MAG: DUF3426 domain-containing protein [Sideroxydans sp.]|nr:DUF3426 domain-containing protein [Sideroxydans sp.]